MGHRHSVLKPKDVQRPSLTDMPYPVLKRILQYVYSSGGSEALPCRLVSHAFNDAMLMNIRLHLCYSIRPEPERCHVHLEGERGRNKWISTDQLVNCRLVERIFDMTITSRMDDNWDQQDLIRLASELSRPVEVTLHVRKPYPRPIPYAPEPFQLPILPMAQMPQMRVVTIDRCGSQYDLTEAELNFTAGQPHLHQLTMSYENLLQLSSHIDTSKISQLSCEPDANKDWTEVGRQYSNVTRLNVFVPRFELSSLRTFTRLRSLQILFASEIDPPSFVGVKLLNLVELDIDIFGVDSVKLWLTSMCSAMPKLTNLSCNLTHRSLDGYPVSSAQRMSTNAVTTVIQFCPATVEELHFHLYNSSYHPERTQSLSRSKWHRFQNALFTAVLNSRLTRVSFQTFVKPIEYDLDAMPFQFKKSRYGVQVGLPVKTRKRDSNRWIPVHKYQLKKRNGQICTLDVIYTRYTGT